MLYHFVDHVITPCAEQLNALVFFKVSFGSFSFPVIILWLLCAGLYFTFYFRFVNVWGGSVSLAILRGEKKYSHGEGEVSHFQGLATALSGTIGVGNIGAVAIAVSLGGPGATFWMIVAGFLAMTTKFVECSLGLKYRRVNANETVSGGPMFYLEKGLKQLNKPLLGRSLGKFYALCIVIGCLGIGNLFQTNQAGEQFKLISRGIGFVIPQEDLFFGLFMALGIGLVIIGGIKSIAQVTEKLIPLMALLYLSGAFTVIITNHQYLYSSLWAILTEAFQPQGIEGGTVGAMVWGFQRALFSNEAGLGSASIAHSAVQTSQPLSEGFVSLLEPFIDTVIICTITSLVIVTSQQAHPELFHGVVPGVAMTSKAFTEVMPWSFYPFAIVVFLFAFSTILSWSYYGVKAWVYLWGEGKKRERLFQAMFCFVITFGSLIPFDAIIQFSDALLFLVCVPNIIGMYYLAPILKEDMNQFLIEEG